MQPENSTSKPTIITTTPPPVEGTWFWYCIWGIAWFLRLLTASITVIGRENLPMKRGSVVTCNHTRGMDYVPLGMTSPRQVFFMVKAEAFDNPILGWIMRNGGGIPVQRGKGDTHAVQRAIDKVVEGYPLAIFPEGTRSKDGTLQAAHTGAVRIAMHAKAPIVPAVVIGAERAIKNLGRFWARVPITVIYGEPMDVSGDPSDREQVVAQTTRVMLAMASMLPPEMRGIWADGKGKVLVSGVREGNRKGESALQDHEDDGAASSQGDSGKGALNSGEATVTTRDNGLAGDVEQSDSKATVQG